MAEKSYFWETSGTGDGTGTGFTDEEIFGIFRAFCGNSNQGGVAANVLNELAVTGTSSPVAVNTGRAIVYGIPYYNSASVNVAVSTPAVSTRIDRVVLQADWAAQTVRIALIAGSEGGAAPSLTQTPSTTWEIPLAQVSITTGGVITVTDEREWLTVVGDDSVTAAMMADDAIETAAIADDAVTGANIADYAIDPRSHISGTNGIVVDPQNGSSRGTDAVDLQTVRGSAGQVAAGNNSTVGGGHSNQADGAYSGVPMGFEGVARLHGQMAHSAGKLSVAGDAQYARYILRKATTNATPTELFLDNSSARMTIAVKTTWVFSIFVAAKNATDPTKSAGYKFEGVIARNSTSTTAIVGSVTKTVLGEDTAAWDADVTADDTNEALVITVTGQASNTIYWAATVHMTEVTAL